MTIRNLEKLLRPASVALVGASSRPHSIGNTIAKNLLAGGFQGRISFVNPCYTEIEGRPCHASVGALPEAPELAVIATPPATIPGIAGELAARGTRAVVVITAGIDPATKQAILEAGRGSCVRVLGPNCIGLLIPPLGLNASFAHRSTSPGKLAFLSQSGALVTAVIDWAASRSVGFSHIVSLGDMADADFGDLIDYLAGDPDCSAILLYIEAITHAPKFMSAARRAARVKPVIAIKSGRNASAAKAAASHTGALAGADAAYDAAFRRAGIVRVRELHDLFSAAEMIAKAHVLKGERLAILTNGGGAGVLAADALADRGGTLATLSPATSALLDQQLPAAWSHGNPVDIIGDADTARYTAALRAVAADPGVDAVLVMNCPTALSSSDDIARAVVAADISNGQGKTLITNWLGADAAAPARARFTDASIPTFETPSAAVEGFMQLVRHKRGQDELMRTPPRAADGGIDRDAAQRIIADALSAGRTMLPGSDASALLATYGIPVVETRIAAGPSEAGEIAAEMLTRAGAVVLKVRSDDISHKSDVGGVRLGLATPADVEAAANDMLSRIARLRPGARFGGFTVSPQIKRPRAHELILGMAVDPTFGPLILFGAGGVGVEVINDTALALPPLDPILAEDLIRETRVARLLGGYRDREPANLGAVVDALVRLATLVTDHPAIQELDINPFLVDHNGGVCLDARVKLADPTATPRIPPAIRPYPSQWQRDETLDGVGEIVIRPIRPDDEALYAAFFDRVLLEDRRLRLFAPIKTLTHGFLARLTQIDYAREIAFVALNRSSGELLGVVRYAADPDLMAGEYGVLVRSDLKGRGLGWRLMQHLIDYARAEGIAKLTGAVLVENTAMLRMCRELGFQIEYAASDPGVVAVTLNLAGSAPRRTD